LASADRRRDTAVRTFLLLCPAAAGGGGGGCGWCSAGAARAAFSGGDTTKPSEWKDGQAEEKAMVASSSSSASELFMYSSSPNVAAPWLLLLPRTGHLKCRLEKESESCGFLAVMVLMVVRCLAVFSFSYPELAQAFLKQAEECNGLESYALVLGCVREVIFKLNGAVGVRCSHSFLATSVPAPHHSPQALVGLLYWGGGW
jgi:hypothetical protein